MDHLLMPKNAAHDRTEVAFLSTETYNGPFESFPRRNGREYDKLWKDEFDNKEVGVMKALLQTWLFFRLLTEVFGDLMKPSDWIRKGRNGRDVISTMHLRSLLLRLHKIQEQLPSEAGQIRREHIDACLNIAIDTVNSLSLRNSPLIESNEVLSIAILCDLIQKSFGTRRGAYRASGSLDLGVSQPLKTRMLGDGWCKNDVHRLAHQLDLSSFYLASNLERPEAEVVHDDCTNRLCVKSQIDEKNYVTCHDTKSCDGNCEDVGVSRDELASILHSGFVPLICYDAQHSPDKIRLVPAITKTSYVAISHVWSHGLGNRWANSLPQCQMRRISGLVNSLPRDSGSDVTLFWLDTICFPVHSPETADLAIIFMRKTYTEAVRVLVIDRYLEAVESKPLLRTECLMRILCSSWTRRLWTLQEGALAKALYFQFADEAIELEQAAFFMTAEMTFVTNDLSLEYQPISSTISELWEVWKSTGADLPRTILNYLSNGLRWRGTSVASDEALCLATLAGIDMEKIMDAAPERRMDQFWSLLPNISAQTVFWTGSKIKLKSLRWAPATFLGESEGAFQDFANKSFSEMDDKSSARRTESGLVFRCAGILLNTWRANIAGDLWIRDEKKAWYRLHRRNGIKLEPQFDNDPEQSSLTLALIVKSPLSVSFSELSPERAITCVVASIHDVDEEDDIIYANTEDMAYLIPQGDMASLSTKEPFVAELVAESERILGMVGSESSPEGSRGAIAGYQAALGKLGEQPVESESAQKVTEDIGRANIKVRDESERLTIDMNGDHYMFDVVELSEDQTWCLD
jgi:hypothetical protein